MKKLLALTIVMLAAASANALLAIHPPRKTPPPVAVVADPALFKDRMFRHGDDMTDLLFAVVLRDHGTAARLGYAIAAEPPLAGAAAGSFARLDREMKVRAGQVAAAASRDDARLAGAYGGLVESCAACHQRYRPK